MRRRDTLAFLGGAAFWPHIARAQGRREIGVLGSGHPDEWAPFLAAFGNGLAANGYLIGTNATTVSRWAENSYDRLPGLAAELVNRRVALIVAVGGDVAAWAAKRATSSIPIVSTFGADPVAGGLVASLNRPGGNLTGVSLLSSDLEPKRVELLVQLVPHASLLGLLVNPANPNSARVARDAVVAAETFKRRVVLAEYSGSGQLSDAFDRLVSMKVGALLVASDPVAIARHKEIVALAEQKLLPAIYYRREFVAVGGLVSYGPSFADAYRLIGEYAGRLLSGGEPAEMPVQQSVKLEMFINLKTARTLGLSIPDAVLLRADEVVE